MSLAHGRAPIVAVSLCTALTACFEREDSKSPAHDRSDARLKSIWFADVAPQAGITAKHDSGHRERFYFPESVCGGGGLLDIDNDGWLDVYLLQAGNLKDPPEQRPGNRLYRNAGNGKFEDVSQISGADEHGYSMGLATGDYDNDGDTDIYVTNLGPNVLLQNDGHGKFTNVAEQAGVSHSGFGAGAAFFDYNADGHLDLFLANYVHWSLQGEGFCSAPDGGEDYCGPKTYRAPTDDVLYKNNGDGTFTDATREAGIADAPGNGLGVVCADFNNDGKVDVYVANDSTRNRLWMNQGDGRFKDMALELGCALDDTGIEKAGMGVSSADIDDDGDLDLVVVNLFLETDSLYRNDGAYFADVTARMGLGAITRKYTRFGVGLHDFNNDGLLDLFESSGKVFRVPPFHGDDPYAEPNILMRGTGNGKFEEILPHGGTASSVVATSRAAAFGDFDNDGGVDIFIVNRDAAPHLLRNICETRGHWIQFRVLEEHGRDALGANVIVSVGERDIRRDVRTAYSYCAANDPRVHFGLGQQSSVDDVEVVWADGQRQRFGPFKADQIVTLQRILPGAQSQSDVGGTAP